VFAELTRATAVVPSSAVGVRSINDGLQNTIVDALNTIVDAPNTIVDALKSIVDVRKTTVGARKTIVGAPNTNDDALSTNDGVRKTTVDAPKTNGDAPSTTVDTPGMNRASQSPVLYAGRVNFIVPRTDTVRRRSRVGHGHTSFRTKILAPAHTPTAALMPT
jgi:hypothetical protein